MPAFPLTSSLLLSPFSLPSSSLSPSLLLPLPFSSVSHSPASSLAASTGATGVQKNAAIPEKAPETAYWAVAGGGSRLDGKAPTPLKDGSGKEMNVREIRAAAAAARLAASSPNPPPPEKEQVPLPAPRKSRIGNKFSKKMAGGSTAFGGAGNSMS